MKIKYFFFSVVALLLAFSLSPAATAQIPRSFTVQGVLTDSTSKSVGDGIHTITLRLYSTMIGGKPVHTEEFTTPVFKGLFNLTLGSITPLSPSIVFDKQYYIGISCDGNSEIARIPFSSVPYSFMAATVPDGSITSNKIADGSITPEKLSFEFRNEKKSDIGLSNSATGTMAFIGGGDNNIASGSYSAVVGGNTNKAQANYAIAAGGQTNTANATYATVSGGTSNTASASNATIGGGGGNSVSGSYAVISGGNANNSSGSYSFIGSGRVNSISGQYDVIGGGYSNSISSQYSGILGGYDNTVSGDYSVILGGNGLLLTSNASRSIGFLSNTSSRSMTISAPNVAVFGNTDLWIASNDGTTRSLKLFSNNLNASGAYPSTTAKNIALKAPDALANDYTLVLPPDSGATGQILVSSGNGVLSWGTGGASGSAGGDLTGSYPNPQIASGVVTSAKITDGTIADIDINSAAGISYSKLNLTNSIITTDITNGSVTTPKLADSAVSGLKLLTNAVSTGHIADDAVTSAKISDGSIVNADVSASAGIVYSKLNLANSIVTGDITNGSITTSKLADSAVSGLKLLTSAVTTGHIADDAVTSAKIFDGSIVNADVNASAAIAYSKLSLTNSIVTGDITNGSITTTKLADSAVSGLKLLTGAVATGHIADEAVTSAKISDGSIANADVNASAAIAYSKLNLANSIVTGDITNGSITTSKLADSAVSGLKLLTNAVSTGHIADAAVTSAKIADGSIVNADVNASAAIAYSKLSLTNSIVTGDITNGSVTTSKLADSAVSGLKLLTGAVTTGHIADDAVTSAKIADGSIVNADVNASAAIAYSKLALTNSIVTSDITNGSVTTSKLADSAVSGLKLLTSAVTTGHIADAAVTSAKIVDGSIVNADVNASAAIAYSKLALTNSIVTNDITNGTVTTSKLADSAVSGLKLLTSAVTTGHIANGSVTGAKIAGNAIDGGKIALGSDATGDIMYYNGTDYVRLPVGTDGDVLTLDTGIPSWAAAGGGGSPTGAAGGDLTNSYPNPTIAANAVNSSKIADLTIVNGDISNSAAIAYSKLSLSNSIVAGDLTSNSVTTAKINGNAVDGSKIALGSDATGDIMYYNGTDYARLARGTDGDVLTLTSGLPSWEAASGGGGGGSGGADAYGDGTAGAVTISSVTDWSSSPPSNNNLQFTSLTVNANLTVPTGTIIRCTGAFTLGAGVTITVSKETSYEDGGAVNAAPYGGRALNASSYRFGGIAPSSDLEAMRALSNNKGGSSGGSVGLNQAESMYGNRGGGRLTILANGNLSVSGTITANGESNANPGGGNIVGAGGGSGGVIVLASKGTVTISGAINARGGNGADASNTSGSGEGGGGGGGGGLVYVIAPAANSVSTSNVSLTGGTGGTSNSTSTSDSPGMGGGGCGGSGGNGGARVANSLPTDFTYAATAGGTGRIVKIQVAKPENVVKY